MKQHLSIYLKNIEEISGLLITQVKIGQTIENYTVEEFRKLINDNTIENLENDFLVLCKMPNMFSVIESNIKFQIQYLNNILLNYSSFLPEDIFLELTDFCNVLFKTLNLSIMQLVDEDDTFQYNQYFKALCEMESICTNIKRYYNILY